MSDLVSINPDECQSCGFVTKPESYTKGNDKTWICEVCAGTLAGNAHTYPDQYRGDAAVLKTIAYCTNLILEAVKR